MPVLHLRGWRAPSTVGWITVAIRSKQSRRYWCIGDPSSTWALPAKGGNEREPRRGTCHCAPPVTRPSADPHSRGSLVWIAHDHDGRIQAQPKTGRRGRRGGGLTSGGRRCSMPLPRDCTFATQGQDKKTTSSQRCCSNLSECRLGGQWAPSFPLAFHFIDPVLLHHLDIPQNLTRRSGPRTGQSMSSPSPPYGS
jgi:hypothetical protein